MEYLQEDSDEGRLVMSTLTKNLVVAADGGNYECRPSNGGAGTGYMTSVIVVTGLLFFTILNFFKM